MTAGICGALDPCYDGPMSFGAAAVSHPKSISSDLLLDNVAKPLHHPGRGSGADVTVLILVSLPPEFPAVGRVRSEFDLCGVTQAIAEVLPEGIIEVVRGELRETLAVIERHQPDVVFNACEAPLGRPDREAHVAALLEWLEAPFTGNCAQTLFLCRRKDLAKATLRAAGVPVPRDGGFPCIVKPLDQDGSVGVDRDSVCYDRPAMERAVSRLNGPAMIEEYLPGPEYAVALWGRDRAEHVAIAERIFQNEMRIVTYRAKWVQGSYDFENVDFTWDPSIDDARRAAVCAVARAAWDAVGARGYMRVDVRLDGCGAPHVIDVNPNPHLGPPGGMHGAVTHAGWSWERFVRQQLAWA